jgi:hypothetical protein
MSEYQYYEFQAIDRPLTENDRQVLRGLSSRARITASSFVNSYEWGDFKGDPMKLMERWFDLHLYLANWGSRRLMMRLPKKLIDLQDLLPYLGEVDEVTVRTSGANLILDINRDETDPEDWDDGSGWLAALAPLRAELLGGDRRMLYLLWLLAIEAEALPDDSLEPLPGLGSLSASLEALGNFLALDPYLVAAASEETAEPKTLPPEILQEIVAKLPESEKIDLLVRLHDGDTHAKHALRSLVRDRLPAEKPLALRTVGDLRARAAALCLASRKEATRQAEAKRQAEKKAAEKAVRARLDVLANRGDAVWREVEGEIERRNRAGYDRAAALLADLRTLAEEMGQTEQFLRRLNSIRERHSRKGQLVARLGGLGN